MKTRTLASAFAAALFALSAGCATTIHGHERALYYSARHGEEPKLVGSGLHWHLPWNHYVKYDLRWTSHLERIHIHSQDGMHLDLVVVVVTRPEPDALYALDVEAGPGFYEEVVRPALFAASRDGAAGFDHLAIASRTHEVEAAIRSALLVHLEGQHIQVQDVAIQHFDLPPEVEVAVTKKAVDQQTLEQKAVELTLAAKDAEIEQTRRKGESDAAGLAKKLADEQDLAHAEAALAIDKAQADAERAQAQGEADATRIRAEAEKARIAAVSANLTPNYVRLQALDALAKAMSGGNEKVLVMPTGKDGMPAFFAPFFNPYTGGFAEMSGAVPQEKP